MKTCFGCKQSKPTSDFQKRSRSADGLHSRCKPCVAKIHAKCRNSERHRETNRTQQTSRIRTAQEYVANFLSDKACVDCGESDIRVLEFDHVRGVKIASLSYLVRKGKPLEVIIDEIAKCDVRCCNCHRKRTLASIPNCWRVQV